MRGVAAALAQAGTRLDRARDRLSAIANREGAPDEQAFGAAETAYLAARDAYRALLREATGEDPDTLMWRLAA